MSTNNPNVFFELGIRTALNKSICLVKDPFLEKVPFDIVPINYHIYSPDLSTWKVEDEVDKLAKHIKDNFSKNNNCNSLWKYFGAKTQSKEDTAKENTAKETPSKFQKLEGLVVAVNHGLIKCCSQCETIMNKGECPIHGRIKGEYTIYLEAMIYNGILEHILIIKQHVLEKYFETSLDSCIAMAADRSDITVVRKFYSTQMIGKLFLLEGIFSPDGFVVKSMKVNDQFSHRDSLILYDKWKTIRENSES